MKPLARLVLLAFLIVGGCAAPNGGPVAAPSASASGSATARGTSNPATANRARWTLMVYLDANTDLERATVHDLRELLAVGSSPQVRVIALCGRSPESDEENDYTAEGVANLPDWSTCKLLAVEKERLMELDDWGHANMADGDTLARFIETARTRFPAERYALFLDDHGQAWEGCCGDETAEEGKDQLTLPALRDALRKGLGETRLDLLGFDACLMANLEVAREVAPFARYMVASEESEPENGWGYQGMLRGLVARPDMDGAALGKLVTGAYMDSFNKDEESREEGASVTMSVIDLSRVGAVSDALRDLAKTCRETVQLGRDGWLQVARARSRAEQFGASNGDDEEPSDLYDLGSFVSEVSRDVPTARPAAQRVRAALRNAVILSAHGAARPDASGLSVFLPRRTEALNRADPISYADVVGSAGQPWLDFLRAYTTATAAQKKPPRLTGLTCTPRVVANGSSASLRASTTPGELAEAWFVLGDRDGRDSMIIGQTIVVPDKNGVLKESWDGFWFKLGDGRHTVICPLDALDEVHGKKGEFTAQVPAERWSSKQKQWHEVTLHFYLREKSDGTASGRLTHAVQDTKYGPRDVTLHKGDRVRPLYSEIDAKGEESWVYSDEPEDQLHLAKTNGVSLLYEPVDRGTWRVGFMVTDHAENHAQVWTDVEVKN